MKKVVFTLIIAGFFINQTNATNLVLNGSFESGSNLPTPGTFNVVPTQSTLDNWTITSGTVDWIHNTYWNASHGSYSININKPGAMTSTGFTTITGEKYLVSFDMSSNPQPHIALMEVTIGTEIHTFSYDGTGNSKPYNMNWITKSFVFQAQAATSQLSFKNVSTGVPGYFGPALDNVSVTIIPEPGTFLLLGAGLLGLVGFRFKRRKKN